MRTGQRPALPRTVARLRLRKSEAMIMADCGMGMTVVMGVASLLGLGLLASLIVLVWVVVWRLRGEQATPGRGSEGEGR